MCTLKTFRHVAWPMDFEIIFTINEWYCFSTLAPLLASYVRYLVLLFGCLSFEACRRSWSFWYLSLNASTRLILMQRFTVRTSTAHEQSSVNNFWASRARHQRSQTITLIRTFCSQLCRGTESVKDQSKTATPLSLIDQDWSTSCWHAVACNAMYMTCRAFRYFNM